MWQNTDQKNSKCGHFYAVYGIFKSESVFFMYVELKKKLNKLTISPFLVNIPILYPLKTPES